MIIANCAQAFVRHSFSSRLGLPAKASYLTFRVLFLFYPTREKTARDKGIFIQEFLSILSNLAPTKFQIPECGGNTRSLQWLL